MLLSEKKKITLDFDFPLTFLKVKGNYNDSLWKIISRFKITSENISS